jgi:hypothetical protein
MLDNILNAVRRSAGTVQKRGEEVAQGARLRLEIYQLSRELDGLYARLGRAYRAGSDQAVLDDLSAEVARLDEEIAAREALAAELGEGRVVEPADPAQAVHEAAARTRPAVNPERVSSETAEPNLGNLPDLSASARRPVPGSDAPRAARPNLVKQAPAPSNAPTFVQRPDALASPSPTAPAPAASRIWRAKEKERMTDPKPSSPVNPAGPLHEATLEDTNKNIPDPQRSDDFGGLGDEAGRDKLYRHPNTLKEGQAATEHPDPLEK